MEEILKCTLKKRKIEKLSIIWRHRKKNWNKKVKKQKKKKSWEKFVGSFLCGKYAERRFCPKEN